MIKLQHRAGKEEKLLKANEEAADKKRKTRARDRSVKEKGREGQGIKISYFWEPAGNTRRVPESP